MITYQTNISLKPEEIARVLDASGITRPTSDLARINAMYENSDLVISAWDQEQLVGVCRALTDFNYSCYLSDLAVDSAYQKHGIGKEMVRQLQITLGEAVSIVLLSSTGAMSYYPRIGFAKSENAFSLKRQR